MRKKRYPWVIIVSLVIAYAGWHLPGFLLLGLAWIVVYLSSLRFHPRMRHRACGGTGEHHSRLFPWTHRKCGGCQGGRIIRWGAGQWGAGHIQHEHREGRESRAAAKENNVWR